MFHQYTCAWCIALVIVRMCMVDIGYKLYVYIWGLPTSVFFKGFSLQWLRQWINVHKYNIHRHIRHHRHRHILTIHCACDLRKVWVDWNDLVIIRSTPPSTFKCIYSSAACYLHFAPKIYNHYYPTNLQVAIYDCLLIMILFCLFSTYIWNIQWRWSFYVHLLRGLLLCDSSPICMKWCLSLHTVTLLMMIRNTQWTISKRFFLMWNRSVDVNLSIM